HFLQQGGDIRCWNGKIQILTFCEGRNCNTHYLSPAIDDRSPAATRRYRGRRWFKTTNRACGGLDLRHRDAATVRRVGSLTRPILQHNIAALWRHPTRSSDKPSPTTAS